jgi:AraC family transcriptional regulator
VPDLERIVKAVDFIEAHLKEPLTVSEIAEAAVYSVYYFCRVFNQAVHHSPYDYVMRRKLSESARDLAVTDRRIIDVAFDYGFNSPEIFSRAFKRMFAQTPSVWRQNARLDRRHFMDRVTLNYLAHIARQGGGLKPEIVALDALHLSGLMVMVDEDRAGIRALWDTVGTMVPSAGTFYGLAWYLEDGRVSYMAAVEAPESPNPAFVSKTLSPVTYARFTHTGPPEALPLTLAYVYQTWLGQSDRVLAQPYDLTIYESSGAERFAVCLPLRPLTNLF